ncbi:hypothetical protein [Burkholderia cenocepacia]|uniref:hypothetical protein n=1 Tax=Burkholderia cenocepacia TaxID=95486 RepID=UPI001CF1A31F|nr:hypothetical protein [Burkholderia cenocepacia]MCA8237155.1 hypothetical protein [Burkholderia cenocepacia]
MTNLSIRQKYLSLVARLYDLAADYTDAELRTMHENFVAKDDQGITAAINALMTLHGAGLSESKAKKLKSETSPPVARADPSDILNEKSLESLLNDRDLFPTLDDIKKIVPGDFPLQHKEGRGRYIKRVIRYALSLDNVTKDGFRKALSSELAKRPDNFVSRWKNLIREL